MSVFAEMLNIKNNQFTASVIKVQFNLILKFLRVFTGHYPCRFQYVVEVLLVNNKRGQMNANSILS